MADDDYILVRIKRRIAYLISSILRGAAVDPFYNASKADNPERARALRQDGEDISETARNVDKALGRMRDEP